jgi:ribonuclease VapC
MVLDSSAIVAIHLREPGHERLIEKIDAAEVVVVGVPTLLETATGEDFGRTDIAQV